MDSFPLYIDANQFPYLSSSFNIDQINRDDSTKDVLAFLDSLHENDIFTDMETAIEHVDIEAEAKFHVDTGFVMMDFIRQGRNPGNEISEAKAIRFEYNTLDIYDYSDNYFKKSKIRIPMCLPFKHLYPGNISSFKQILSNYLMLYNISKKSKLIRLDVFGRLLKRYNFYKIEPIFVGYFIDHKIIPL
jgi:hypothetical protein